MIEFIIQHKDLLAETVLALIALGSLVVRLTKTETDDGLLHKIDIVVNKIFDFLKLPNRKKDDK